jgi:hypothetical protein
MKFCVTEPTIVKVLETECLAESGGSNSASENPSDLAVTVSYSVAGPC